LNCASSRTKSSKAARRGGELAQREQQCRAGAARPQEQREMREVAALAEGSDEIGHGASSRDVLQPDALPAPLVGEGAEQRSCEAGEGYEF